ncbi:MAG TPA: hypothetical protein PKM50_03505 [Methanoregula sp.]|nr:hypothetical protein [Methanoregula sp.]
MENSGSDAGENRVAALETKVNGIEALVGEFMQELLDLKAVTRGMSRQTGEHRLQEYGSMQGADVPVPDAAAETDPQPQEADSSVPGSEPHAEEAVPPAQDEPVMVMIMQTDGTMKPEIRLGNRNCFSAPVGYGVSGGSGRYNKGIHIMPGQSRLT